MTETPESTRSRRNRTMDRVEDTVNEGVDKARVEIDRAKEIANRGRDDVEGFAKDNPLLVLGAALLVGIGIGVLATAICGRRSRD